ncbi:hypothetical protein JMM59_13280 [Rhodovulum sulfidophilum]|uniref:MAE_28990/MAE_18760 family HEPN-like nuclease n=1 Tax=Rhodovulum sulfidophilum TaxID=35806 RepID=UPI0019228CC6|nr:MAE_28990/MAE_18760 family HEPN-like nuclease [Rhodovulum sulfidophilum]MBL3565968.1 hypothetical protein [Rhodovulum sulfidophilum]
MSKPYTADDFSSLLALDRTWRIREISDLKLAIRRGDAALQRVLLRAHVAISYAHWEGHVRLGAKLYLTHIALRKFPYEQLDRQFLKNYFLPRLNALSATKASIEARCELLEDILSSTEKKFTRVNNDLINTRSNLNSEILSEICLICGIPFDHFSEETSFIDTILLKRRNAIAHGEDTFVEISDLDDLTDKTIGLMRTFGDALDNNAQLGTYKAA